MKNDFDRIIAIPDIHGCHDILRQLIEEKIYFDPKWDQLIFLGDYIDFRDLTNVVDRGGVNSAKVVEYVSSLKAKFPESVITLKGNHEQLAELALESRDAVDLAYWRINGGDETLRSFANMDRARKVLLPFIKGLPTSHENNAALFVHGNIPEGKTAKTASENDLLWDRGQYQGSKLLIVGHTITDFVKLTDKLYLDLGCYMTGHLVGFDVITGTVYEARERACNEQQLPLDQLIRRN